MAPQDTIAFIGLGVMGYPMAVNLRTKMEKSQVLLISDISKIALQKFQEQMKDQGTVAIVDTGFDAVQKADIVITMLPDGRAAKIVYRDPQSGILAGVRECAKHGVPQKLIMECGTIETATILEIGEATRKCNADLPSGSAVNFVDAPVSGGPMGAEAGTLTFMVGGPQTVFPKVKSVLKHMGIEKSVFLCGDVGSGSAFKIINNYLSAITSLAASEALNIGAKMGLDLKLLTDVINTSGGQCWVTSKSNPVPGVHLDAPASRNYEGGFRIELCKKVLQMGSELAHMVGAKTVLDKPTLEAFDDVAADSRYQGKDARVVYKWLNESKGS